MSVIEGLLDGYLFGVLTQKGSDFILFSVVAVFPKRHRKSDSIFREIRKEEIGSTCAVSKGRRLRNLEMKTSSER